MTSKEFNKFTHKTVTKIESLLCKKGDEYSQEYDRFENFYRGAAFLGQSKEEVLLGYLTKHLVSVADIIQTNSNWDKLTEKTHDIIAYMILLEAMATEKTGSGPVEKN